MNYWLRIPLFIAIDTCIILSSILFSLFLVEGDFTFTFPTFIFTVIALLSHYVLSIKNKLYKKAWEYASVGELLSILKVVVFQS